MNDNIFLKFHNDLWGVLGYVGRNVGKIVWPIGLGIQYYVYFVYHYVTTEPFRDTKELWYNIVYLYITLMDSYGLVTFFLVPFITVVTIVVTISIVIFKLWYIDTTKHMLGIK